MQPKLKRLLQLELLISLLLSTFSAVCSSCSIRLASIMMPPCRPRLLALLALSPRLTAATQPGVSTNVYDHDDGWG